MKACPCFCVGCTRIVSARQQPRQKGFYSYLHANICFPRFWLARMKACPCFCAAGKRAKVHFVLIFSLCLEAQAKRSSNKNKNKCKSQNKTKVHFVLIFTFTFAICEMTSKCSKWNKNKNKCNFCLKLTSEGSGGSNWRPEAKANKNKNNGYCNGYSRPRPAEATGEANVKSECKKQMFK